MTSAGVLRFVVFVCRLIGSFVRALVRIRSPATMTGGRGGGVVGGSAVGGVGARLTEVAPYERIF